MSNLQLDKGVTYDTFKHQIYMYRCPKCNRENYIMNVLSGICTWCGYDAKELIPKSKEEEE